MIKHNLAGTVIRSATVLLLSCIVFTSCNTGRKSEITKGELVDHLRFLTSDELKGRSTGSVGDSLSAEYIRSELISYGLVPMAEEGFQTFMITDRIVEGNNNYFITNNKEFVRDTDFMPFAFSGNAGLEAGAVFAGFGFNINNDSLQWNDYQDIDVKGKWVIILRADPEPEKSVSGFLPFSGDRDKALLAKDMGAAGVLLVAGEVSDKDDKFDPLQTGDYSLEIPVLRIKREVANAVLMKSGKSIESLEEKIIKSRRPFSLETNETVSAGSEIVLEKTRTRNVVMLLPGEDEILKDEYIIIGAHFDHLGMGGPGSSSRAVDTIAVHHGADDNASGVGALLELAEKFALTKNSHKRSIVFTAFSGEEMGLLGSKHFVDDSPVDLGKVNAMINIDMIGRLDTANSLQISGAGTAQGLKDMIVGLSDTTLMRFTYSDAGYGPSDHSSFYGKNIPVLFYSTGAHLDYHTPSDTYDKINYEGMISISDQIFKAASELVNSSARLSFRESGPRTDVSRTVRRRGITLGIMPDFAGNVKDGLRADFVTPGKPAALGGMKKGDIITSINGKSVKNIQDYMFRMGQLKHGQTINVEIIRDNKKEVLLIQL